MFDHHELQPEDDSMIKDLLDRWPRHSPDPDRGRWHRSGGDERRTKNLLPKNHDAEFTRSICPYCGVGCGQMVFHKDGELISIEGDPGSPISRGHLCPKGADTFELHTHPEPPDDGEVPPALCHRVGGDSTSRRRWTWWPIGVGEPRSDTFVEEQDGEKVMHTKAVAHLGGATLDNEENYLIKKLFCGGLGMVCISNQARI